MRQMFDKIEQWQKSGLSQRAWCNQDGLPYYRFHYWYKRYRDASHSSSGGSSGFLELKVKPVTTGFAELICPDGKRLVFHEPVSSDFIKAIIG